MREVEDDTQGVACRQGPIRGIDNATTCLSRICTSLGMRGVVASKDGSNVRNSSADAVVDLVPTPLWWSLGASDLTPRLVHRQLRSDELRGDLLDSSIWPVIANI